MRRPERARRRTMDARAVLLDQDGGAVLFDRRSGQYIQLNAVGERVVRGLLDREDLAMVVAQVAADMAVPPERVRADVETFLDDLAEAGVLR
jgi:hypothetical protein